MKIFKRFFPGNILYYPGCLTKKAIPNLQKKYEKILKALGIDFIQLSDLEACCGSPVLNSGSENEFKKLAQKNLKIFREHAVKKIITNCPACFKVFSKDYSKILGKKWDIQVEHITQTIANGRKNLKRKKQDFDQVSYHDPCHLGRQMKVIDEPRKILKDAGLTIKELRLNQELSFCCGAGGGVKANNPATANKLARERLAQVREAGIKCLITSCPLCFLHLKENANDLEVREISEIL